MISNTCTLILLLKALLQHKKNNLTNTPLLYFIAVYSHSIEAIFFIKHNNTKLVTASP